MTRKGERTVDAYGYEHRRIRAEWAPYVAAGMVNCWRCGGRIDPGEPWDLGHDDTRTVIMGPEHRHRRRDLGCDGNRHHGYQQMIKLLGGRRKRSTTTPPYGGDDEWS